jgi:hypothetical protein
MGGNWWFKMGSRISESIAQPITVSNRVERAVSTRFDVNKIRWNATRTIKLERDSN